MFKDIASNLETSLAVNVQTLTNTTPVVGNIIDTKGAGGIMFSIFSASTGTIDSVTPSLAESDDSGMSGGTAVDDADLVGTEAGAVLDAVNEEFKLGYTGKKRYVQLTLTGTGTNSIVVGALAVKGELLKSSTAQ